MRRRFRDIMVMGQGGGARYLFDLTPNAAFGVAMRKLRIAYTGSAIRLRRDSDNAELDFAFAGDGSLDAVAIAAWLGAASGYGVTWYDQSGNGNDFTQATTTRQPLYVASGIGGKPDFYFDGANTALICSSNFSSAQQGTIMAVAKFAAPIPNFWNHILSSRDEASATRYFIVRGVYSAPDAWPAILQRDNDVADEVFGEDVLTTGVEYTITWRSDGADYYMTVNGDDHTITVNTGANNGDWLGDVSARDNFVIGANFSGGAYSGHVRGDLSEVTMWDRFIT